MRLLLLPAASAFLLRPAPPSEPTSAEKATGRPANPFLNPGTLGPDQESYFDEQGGKWRKRYVHGHAEASGLDIDAIRTTFENTTSDGKTYASGYSHVTCVHDEQLIEGNKYGEPQKFNVNNPVSIIRYDDVIAMQHRAAMSESVCYEFCRRFDHVKFFGLTNGSECYCNTFFKAAAGQSGLCDVPCVGNSNEMCGGNAQTSMFEMHKCPTPPPMNATQLAEIERDSRAAGTYSRESDRCANQVAEMGRALEKVMNDNGNNNFSPQKKSFDSTWANLQAQVKAFPRGVKLETASTAALGEYRQMTEQTNPAERERRRHGVEDTHAAVEDALPLLEDLFLQCRPNGHMMMRMMAGHHSSKDLEMTGGFSNITDATTFTEVTDATEGTMCQGEILGGATLMNSAQECADYCKFNRDCSGYQVYGGLYGNGPSGRWHETMCMLYGKVTAVTEYRPDRDVGSGPGGKCGGRAFGHCYVYSSNFPALKEFKTKKTVLKRCFNS